MVELQTFCAVHRHYLKSCTGIARYVLKIENSFKFGDVRQGPGDFEPIGTVKKV